MPSPIRCGIAFFPPNWIDLELAAYAEDLGFDALWIGEHIAFHIPTFDAVTAMAAVAARTTRIGIGIAALLLPLRPAAAVAKAVATLDVISGGRVRRGLASGANFPRNLKRSVCPCKGVANGRMKRSPFCGRYGRQARPHIRGALSNLKT